MKYIIIAAAVIAVLILLKVIGDRKYKRNRIFSAERSFGTERRMTEEACSERKTGR